MEAVVWGDPICPWCYVGQRRTAQLEEMGLAVTRLPYELHPGTPDEGRPIVPAPGTRIEAVYRHLAEAAAAEGLPFQPPTRLPNTRRVLETLVVAAGTDRSAADRLWALAYAAHFADGRFLGDRAVVGALVAEAGLDPGEVGEAVDEGAGRAGLDEAREAALEAGAVGVPSWLIDGRLLLPGLQDAALFDRVVARLSAVPPDT